MRSAAGQMIKDMFLRVVKMPDGKEPDQLDADELDEFFGFCKP